MSIIKNPPYQRIATEEAFLSHDVMTGYKRLLADNSFQDPGFRSLWGFYSGSPSPRAQFIFDRLQDLGPARIADMDASGISRQIIALTAPGVQVFDPATGSALAIDANDQLAEACARYPDRYTGMVAVAPHDPANAVKEMERGVRKLGFKAVIINSHTHGHYLDEPQFAPVLEAAEALQVPIYLHPQTPPASMIGPILDAGLDGAVFGFGVETGLHMLRVITGGVFDRFPKLQFIIGHAGEALPFWMYRLDFMHTRHGALGSLFVHEGPEASRQPLPAQQRLRHQQWRGLAAGHRVLPEGARRRPRAVRDGLPVSVRAG